MEFQTLKGIFHSSLCQLGRGWSKYMEYKDKSSSLPRPPIKGCLATCQNTNKHKTLIRNAPNQIDLDSLTGSNFSCRFNSKSYMLVANPRPDFWQCHQQALGPFKSITYM